MNALSQTRQDVSDTLVEAGIVATDSIPDRITPPIAVIMPGNPYVEDGNTTTNVAIQLVVRVITNVATNEVMADALDDVISAVVIALKADQWTVSVSEPFALAANNTEYPAVDITISNWITL